jgi:glycosyltransferase involved in cell wall biosynthesis
MTKERARARLALRVDGPLFVCAGFVQPDKGFDRAIRAFATAGSRGRLAIVGSVREATPDNLRYAGDLRGLAERFVNVAVIERFVDDEDFDAWIRAADVFVLPYRRAWSSGALARAQRLGTPAFVAAVGGLAEQAGERDRVFGTDDELVELMHDAMRPADRRRTSST